MLHLCTGDLGARGTRGVIGPTGLKGFPGSAGKRGFEGRIGKRGQQGKPGLKGKTGRVVRAFILCFILFEVSVLSDFVKAGRAGHVWCQNKGGRALHASFLSVCFVFCCPSTGISIFQDSQSISVSSVAFLYPSVPLSPALFCVLSASWNMVLCCLVLLAKHSSSSGPLLYFDVVLIAWHDEFGASSIQNLWTGLACVTRTLLCHKFL